MGMKIGQLLDILVPPALSERSRHSIESKLLTASGDLIAAAATAAAEGDAELAAILDAVRCQVDDLGRYVRSAG